MDNVTLEFFRHYFMRFLAGFLVILATEAIGFGIIIYVLLEIRDVLKKRLAGD